MQPMPKQWAAINPNPFGGGKFAPPVGFLIFFLLFFKKYGLDFFYFSFFSI